MNMRWTEHTARTREMRNPYRTLFEYHGRKILFGRFRRRWENNTEINLKEIMCEDQKLDSAGSR
jgi:hypothetical protein